MHNWKGLLLAVFVTACDGGREGKDGPGPDDTQQAPLEQGGPHSLVGFEWRADPITAYGITFAFGFRFDSDTVTASNTCDGSLTATAQSPVRYRYTATIQNTSRQEETDGQDSCFVEIASGEVAFEIVEDRLDMTFQGETVSFSPDGQVAGLYGGWAAEVPFGRLIWSMGGGRIVATAQCDNGLSATTQVDADFVNLLDIVTASDDVVEADGLECSIGISETEATYTFEGDTLILVIDGEPLRLEKN